MANAKRDQNYRPVQLAVSSVDNATPLMLHVDPITSYLLISFQNDSTTIPSGVHRIDQNDVPTCYGVSSADGLTLIPIRTDSLGRLLIQFT